MSTLAGNDMTGRLRNLISGAGMIVLALMINVLLFALAGYLTTQQRSFQDISDPVGVSLVNLAPPEPPRQEQVREPAPPPPAEKKPDFSPDLVKPAISGPDLGGMTVGIDIGGIVGRQDPGELIFDSVDLDQAPRAEVKSTPPYPYRAREQGVEGFVAVKFLVDATGAITSVHILKAKPEGYFEEDVRRTVMSWRFKPGEIDGLPVASWVVTTLRFDLN